jgi:MoxR-like ATPase
LDEVDKANEGVDALLLDWLQTARCPVGPGRQVQGVPGNLLVFMTSNEYRPLSPALLRRARRIRVRMPGEETLARIVADLGGCHKDVAKMAVRLFAALRDYEGAEPASPQEVGNFIGDLGLATRVTDVFELAMQWGVTSPETEVELREELPPWLKKATGAVWSEWKRHEGRR